MSAGVEIRHRKSCPGARDDGRCCKPSYRAWVYDARTGKRIRSKPFPAKTAAKLWRQDAITALRRGEFAAEKTRTVADTMSELLAGMQHGTVLDRSGRRYRPATVRSYRQAWRGYLEPSLGRLRLSEVRRRDVQRIIDKMHADGKSGSTIRNKLDPLRVLYRRALEDEQVTRSPMSHLRLPENAHKPRRVVAVDRAGELLDALPDTNRALWATAVFAGLRIGELRALRWSSVDFDTGIIRVQAGWDDQEGEQQTKTAAGTRTVPLVGRLRAELVRHKLATGRSGADLVFGRTATAAFTRSTVRARANRSWKAAKLDPLTPHEMRHTAASYMAAAGLSPKEAQTALGHADIRTTMNVYAKAVPGWETAAAAKLDAFLSLPRGTVAGQSRTQPGGS